MRFDIANGNMIETWFVSIDKGDLTVSRSGGAADSTLVASKALFERLASGKASAVAEVLRGTLTIEGDWRLLVVFRRILGSSTVKPPTTKPKTIGRIVCDRTIPAMFRVVAPSAIRTPIS